MALLLRAIEATQAPTVNAQAYYDEIAAHIASPARGVFVGFDEHDPKAVAVVILPTSPMMMGPQVPLAYSESRALSTAVGVRVRDWLHQAGFDRFFCVNFKHDDKAYARVFGHVGEFRAAGTFFEVVL